MTMAKKSNNKSGGSEDPPQSSKPALNGTPVSMDPSLAALFSSSLNVKTRRKAELSVKPTLDEELTSSSGSGSDSNDDDEELSEISPSESSNDIPDVTVEPLNGDEVAHKKKRKRATDDNDDVEGRYLDRLAREEDVSRKRARAERKSPSNHSDPDLDDEPASNSDDDMEKDVSFEIPQHETVSKGKDEEELEKASRTVFLGNVSTQAIKSGTSKHALMDHLLSFLSDLPNNVPPHKIESLRFRSTAYSDSSLPKKAAFVKRELMDATTQSTNAYAVYSTALAAREAVKRLNGTVVLERHLRVDGVAHPRKTDHRRCVFVGNLGFVDDESLMRASEETEGISKKKKSKPPADVEEGLWRQFGNAGVVESVRVVRDKTTRVGKGFAYVQFKDANSVEKALLFDGNKYPPLLPRPLRVTRAKSITKTASYASKSHQSVKPLRASSIIYRPKQTPEAQSLAGRAGKLLGRAGAAQFRLNGKGSGNGVQRPIKSPEQIIFEGHRARAGHSKGVLKSGKRKGGKPNTRSSKRAAAYKATGRKKRTD